MNSNNKIIRSICFFSKSPDEKSLSKLDALKSLFESKQFQVQTKRLVCPDLKKTLILDKQFSQKDCYLSAGSLSFEIIKNNFDKLLSSNNIAFNLDLTNFEINTDHVELLFNIINKYPAKTFNFTFVFNNPSSSPFFPSANFEKDGFSVGLQPTDLAEGCNNLDEWLNKMKETWLEINELLADNQEFLGIDSSVAPLNNGKSSFVNFVKKLTGDFSRSAMSDIYIQTTKFIKKENPKPIGLCGLMFPALEDFELSDEYEKGNFTIERNIYLSLHSGLGIDTYPIGIDEKPDNILNVLKLVQGLSNKYKKPLSARFVSDGKSKIGQKSDFKNKFLNDVIIRPL
ncbi:MAG: DUF711 family protein [Patescibacteria group bacterium]